MIATIRVWRRQGGSTGVYIVGGAIVVVLLLLCVGLGQSAAKRAQAAEELDEADASDRGRAGAFPVPPMDLPHYHGVGVHPEAVRRPDQPAATEAAAAKEVTGA